MRCALRHAQPCLATNEQPVSRAAKEIVINKTRLEHSSIGQLEVPATVCTCTCGAITPPNHPAAGEAEAWAETSSVQSFPFKRSKRLGRVHAHQAGRCEDQNPPKYSSSRRKKKGGGGSQKWSNSLHARPTPPLNARLTRLGQKYGTRSAPLLACCCSVEVLFAAPLTCFSSSKARKLNGRLGNRLFTSLNTYLNELPNE